MTYTIHDNVVKYQHTLDATIRVTLVRKSFDETFNQQLLYGITRLMRNLIIDNVENDGMFYIQQLAVTQNRAAECVYTLGFTGCVTGFVDKQRSDARNDKLIHEFSRDSLASYIGSAVELAVNKCEDIFNMSHSENMFILINNLDVDMQK